jgi:hypothetical protein
MATNDVSFSGVWKQSPKKERRQITRGLFTVIAFVVVITALAIWNWTIRHSDERSACEQEELHEDQLNCLENLLLSERRQFVPTTETKVAIDVVKKEIDQCAQIRAKKWVDLTVSDRESFGECGISIRKE